VLRWSCPKAVLKAAVEIVKTHATLKPIQALPGFTSLLHSVGQHLLSAVQGSRYETDLVALESALSDTTGHVDVPEGQCVMTTLSRCSFALASKYQRLLSIQASGGSSWHDANASRLQKVNNTFSDIVLTLSQLQQGQFWSAMERVFTSFCQLEEAASEGTAAKIEATLIEQLQDEKLIPALTACGHSGFGKLLNEADKKTFDQRMQVMWGVLFRFQDLIGRHHREGGVHAHLSEAIVDPKDSTILQEIMSFSYSALNEPAFPVTEERKASSLAAVGDFGKSVAKVAARRLGEVLKTEWTFCKLVATALAKNSKKGGGINWSTLLNNMFYIRCNATRPWFECICLRCFVVALAFGLPGGNLLV